MCHILSDIFDFLQKSDHRYDQPFKNEETETPRG